MSSNDTLLFGKEELSAFPPETPLAMCYVPMQKLYTVYSTDAALMQGTLFPELDKPWYGSSKAFATANNPRDGRSAYR